MTGVSRTRAWTAVLLLTLVVFLAYRPALRAGFVWDDDAYITDNAAVQDPGGLPRIWNDPRESPQYYPLVFTTFWIEHRLWGLDPFGYHLANLLLHAANAVLLWVILRGLRIPCAWFVALVFGLHPIQVESVAWVTERKNTLAGLFYLSALLAWFRFTGWDGQKRRKQWWVYLLALLLFVLSLLSKTITASLPAAILIVRWWQRGTWRRSEVLALVPFFLAGLVLGLRTAHLERTQLQAAGGIWGLSLVERLLVAGRSLWFYAGKLLWPVDLSFNYPRWTVDVSDPLAWVWPVLFVAVVALLWALRRSIGRAPLAGLLFYAGTLLPASGLVNLYMHRYSYVADHHVYLAIIGLIAILLVGAVRLGVHVASSVPPGRIGRLIVSAILCVAAAVAVLLGLLTYRQAATYHDLETLWDATLRRNPGSWLAHNNLGNLRLGQRRVADALPHLLEARALEPSYMETRANLAIAWMNLGRTEEAVGEAREAVRLAPGSRSAWATLGDALLRHQEAAESEAAYMRALEIDPDFSRAHAGRGAALGALGRFEDAVTAFRRAVELDPGNTTARTNLGVALMACGRPAEAVPQFQEVLRSDPANELVWDRLEQARQALRREP